MIEKRKNLEIYIDGLHEGGAEHLLLSMLPALVSKFDKIQIVTLRDEYALIREFEGQVEVCQLSVFHLFGRLWTSNSICYVCLSKSIFLAVLISSLKHALGIRETKMYCHEHTSFEFHAGRRRVDRRIFDYVYIRLITHCLKRGLISYIVSSRARKKELESVVKSRSAILHFPNSFPESDMKKLRECRKLNPKDSSSEPREFRMFTLSRLEPVKQLTWAIDSSAALAKQYSDSHVALDIFGKGPDLDRLRHYSQRYSSLGNLKIGFPGFVDSIVSPLTNANLYLFPSRVEGYPLSLTEAALSGISCISTNCSKGVVEIAEYFPNVFLVDPPYHDAFIEAVLRHFESSQEENLQNYSGNEPVHYPSIESLVDKIAAFLLENSQSYSRSPMNRH